MEHTSHLTHHWAFELPKSHPVPSVQGRLWPRTPIDFFILAKLEENGLAPSPGADKRTLIRRATFDLIGLPPRPEAVDAFLADESPEAFARVVDRLLSSPRYGERWGRYWLDVARYADTKGYVYGDREETRFVHSYVYRDWVIRALNEDMPYDRFLRLQIAADQLTPTLNSQRLTPNSDLAAMGFLTLGRRFLGVVHDIIDDRIDVLMRGTQALTVACARCHDHKFDPIPTKDYYALYGVFASCTEKMIPLSEAQLKSPTSADFAKGLEERVEKYHQMMQQKRAEFSHRFRTNVADYLVAVLDVKKLPTEEHYEIRGPNDLNPKIARNWESYLLQTRKAFHPVFGAWHALADAPAEDFAKKAPEILADLAGASTNAVDAVSSRRVNSLVFQALKEKPLQSMRDAAERYGKLLLAVHQRWHQSLQTAVANKTEPPTALPDRDGEELRQVLYAANAPVNIPIVAAADLEWYFDEPTRVQLMKLHAEIERWIIQSPGAPPYSIELEDRPNPKNTRVFVRGNPANKGDEATRQFLEVLSPGRPRPFTTGSGRLELAQAIANKNNPLTARVMVNRIWLHHFGAGLVRTPSDFGTRSEPPSHPELLDWLACYFMNEGWSIKRLHRLIMLSSVYQQSSSATPETSVAAPLKVRSASATVLTSPAVIGAAARDPENRLLWRMNRSRLDFEALRDSLFAVSGELDPQMGGCPIELFKAPFSPRRSVYGFIDRQFLPGVYRVFDFANPDMHNPQRPETTVPQQALFFMNSPFAIERARALLKRTDIVSVREPSARVQKLYQVLFQRNASGKQVEVALNFLRRAEAMPLYQPPPPPAPVWFYGFGAFDADSVRVTNFVRLPYFTGDAWQGGATWPDDKLGWVRLTADGGHVGNDLEHAAIRRWVAPGRVSVAIQGTIKHDHDQGDGVRARIVSDRHGVLGTWTVHKGKAETKIDPVAVETGDTLDFLVDFNANLNHDDFQWAPIIKVTGGASANSSSEYPTEWNAKKEFSGPPAVPPTALTPWEQYAQVLLLANEFVFVD